MRIGLKDDLDLYDLLALGHVAYLSTLIVEVYHSHPVLRTFVELLHQARINRLQHDATGPFYRLLFSFAMFL